MAEPAATAPSGDAWRFGFLGTPAIVGPTGRTELHAVQPALVLGRLVLDPALPLTRHELVDLLWPTRLPTHWAGAGRQVVSRARAALVAAGLPPNSLLSRGGTVSLDPDVSSGSDVEDALAMVRSASQAARAGQHAWAASEAARAAAVCALPFFETSESTWAASWRDRLGAAARTARRLQVEAALAQGRGADAIVLAEAALAADQLDEVVVRLLMGAHLALGDRPAALAAYQRCRQALDELLGVRPSTETEAAYLAALGEAPSSPVSARHPGDGPLRALPSAQGGAPFVGRRPELAAVVTAWSDVRAGGCLRAVVVEGEPGIGKTRLVTEAVATLADGDAVVVWARGSRTESAAHDPFAEVVAQVVAARPDATARMGSAVSDLALVAPEALPEVHPPHVLDDEHVRGRIRRALERLLREAMAGHPMVLVLDDLQWIAADGMDLLEQLVVELADQPLLLVLTRREPSQTSSATLAAIHRTVPVTVHALEGLDADELTELLVASGVSSPGGAAAAASVLAERTAGNPLWVTQMISDALARGVAFNPRHVPAAVSQLLEDRLAGLDNETRATVLLAAVAGPVFDLSTVEACSSSDPERVLDTMEQLCGQGFLEERGAGTFAFVHELVREAVLADAGPTRLARLHRRVGDALASAGAPAELAHHFAAAGADAIEETVLWSTIAADEALGRGAWSTAATLFGAAADLATSPERRCRALVGLGRACRALGDAERSRRVLEEAMALADELGLGAELAAATLSYIGGGGRGVAVHLADAERTALLRRALDELGAGGPPSLVVPLLAELALALVLTDASDERAALHDRCLRVARRWGDPNGLAVALTSRRAALMGPGGTEERAAGARELLSLPAPRLAAEHRIGGYLNLVEDLLELGDRRGAGVALREASSLAERLAHPYWTWAVGCWATLVAIIDGDLEDAEQLAGRALASQVPDDHPEAIAAFGVQLTDVRLLQGRAGEVVGLLAEAAEANPNIPCYRAVLALARAEAGDVAGARAAYDSFAQRDFWLPPDSNWLLAVAVLADVGATLGDAAGAAVLSELLAPWAGRLVILNCYGGGGAAWGPVSHHLGRLAAVAGDRVAARRHLEAARRQLDAWQAPLFAARTEEALAQL